MPSRLRRSLGLAARIAATFARPTVSPFVVFLNVTRRCNLACCYCREYDATSEPVPLPVLRERIAHIARLGTAVVTLNGGEPLLYPDIGAIVAAVREHGMAATLNTNALLLTRAHIEAFNRARLSAMQVSVDGLQPNDATLKSFRTARPKLRLLARHARFAVHVNAVLGAAPVAELKALSAAVRALGFPLKVVPLRAEDGSVPLEGERLSPHVGWVGRLFSPSALDRGERLSFRCRAGARYLHVCDQGRVHWCGATLGAGTISIEDYTQGDVDAAFATQKPCVARCGVAYAHALSRFDAGPQHAGPPHAGRLHLPVVS